MRVHACREPRSRQVVQLLVVQVVNFYFHWYNHWCDVDWLVPTSKPGHIYDINSPAGLIIENNWDFRVNYEVLPRSLDPEKRTTKSEMKYQSGRERRYRTDGVVWSSDGRRSNYAYAALSNHQSTNSLIQWAQCILGFEQLLMVLLCWQDRRAAAGIVTGDSPIHRLIRNPI